MSGSSYELARPVTLLDTTQTFDAPDEATVTTISGRVAGAGALRKSGPGTLVLTNVTNSYGGGTLVDAGALGVGANGQLGALAGGLTFNGGTLDLGRSLRFRTSGHAQCRRGDDPDSRRRQGHLDRGDLGRGALTKIGAGELVLGGTGNSYSGGTFVNGGTLTVASDTLLGDPAGGLTLDGGTLNVPAGSHRAPGDARRRAAGRSSRAARARHSPALSRGLAG